MYLSILPLKRLVSDGRNSSIELISLYARSAPRSQGKKSVDTNSVRPVMLFFL